MKKRRIRNKEMEMSSKRKARKNNIYPHLVSELFLPDMLLIGYDAVIILNIYIFE